MAAVLMTVLLWAGRVLLAHFIVRALAGAGLAWATYHYAVGPLFDLVRSYSVGANATVADWIGFLGIDRAFTVLASAYTIRSGLKFLHLVRA